MAKRKFHNPTESSGSFVGGLLVGVGGGFLLSTKTASSLLLKATGGNLPPCLMATVAHPEGEPYFPNPQPGVNCNAGMGTSGQSSGTNYSLYIAMGGVGLVGYLVGGWSGAFGAVIGAMGVGLSRLQL